MEVRTGRPPRVREAMKVSERAKQFAPFAALGSMEGVLQAVVDGRDVGDPEREQFFDDLENICAEDQDIDMLDDGTFLG